MFAVEGFVSRTNSTIRVRGAWRSVQHTPGMGNLEPDSEEHYNFNGVLDEKAEIKYTRDAHGNWTLRTVFVWDAPSNQMIQVEQDTRTIEYY